jgi:hypothetical protein
VVADLWIPNTKTWNMNFLTTLFGPQKAYVAANIPICKGNIDDMLVWKHT